MWRIGHRGAAGHAVENTLASIDKAVSLGCEMIEVDIRRCASGELVVFHDNTTTRIAGTSLRISETDYTTLRGLALPSQQHIPLLTELLDHLVTTDMILCIELKEEGLTESLLPLLQQACQQGWNPERLLVISFFHQEVHYLKQQWPELPVGVAFTGAPLSLAQMAVEVKAQTLHLHHQFVTDAMVTDAHQHGIHVMVWTVNEPEEITHAWQRGVDGITSDYPERIHRYRPSTDD